MIRVLRTKETMREDFIKNCEREGMLTLNRDDYEYFSEKYQPLVAIRVETVTDFEHQMNLMVQTMRQEMKQEVHGLLMNLEYHPDHLFSMSDMEYVHQFMCIIPTNAEAKYSLTSNAQMVGKRAIEIFFFGKK